MTVEPDGQQPIDDDDSVLPEDQTANLDSSFDRSLPPAGKTTKKAGDETKKETNKETHKEPGNETRKEETSKAETSKEERTVSGGQTVSEIVDDSENAEKAKDSAINRSGAERRKSIAKSKSGLDAAPSMSILQTERSIAQKPGTTPDEGDSTGVGGSKPDTADDSFSDRSSPIGRYTVRRLLGQGAFGRVYEAHDPQLDRLVAVKVSKDIRGRDAVDRFLREARSAAHLRHPAIIPVFEYGQIGDLSMIVYELVDGETLRSYTKRNAPLELSESISIIRKIAEGLDYAHEQGIIHRDMKPDNVLIDKKGEPHIADFGCARRFDDQDMHQTMEGSILGTPMYMSPEQASGQSHHADGRTDVWSLGVMLYEMVSGQKPFEGKLSDLLHLIRHHDPKPLRKVHSSTPRDIETICSKCLRRELDHRFATAGDLAEEIERYERGEPIVSRRISVLTRTWLWAKRNRAVASLLTAVVVTLLAGITVSLYFGITASNALMAKTEAENKRAATSLKSLATAESSSLQNILKDLELSSSSMLTRIRQKLKELGRNDHKQQRRLGIALLHLVDDKERVSWFDEKSNQDLMLSADGDELTSFCKECWVDEERVILIPDLQQNLVPELWKISLDTTESNERRFRASCALAQLDPPDSDSGPWEKILPDVAGHLTAMNLNNVQQWLPMVVPIRDFVKSELELVFANRRTLDNAGPENAAAILSNLCKDDSDYIMDKLLPIADARQLNHLMTALQTQERRETSRGLIERLKNMDQTEVSNAQNLDQQMQALKKANLILALIQLEVPETNAWKSQLQHGNKTENSVDNTVGTEVIERLGPASTSVELLLKMIDAEWQAAKSGSENGPDVLAVEILALGQFNESQIPQTKRDQIVSTKLKEIFVNHGDARVHSSARWLMQQWDNGRQVSALENSPHASGGLQTKEPDADKNWHVDLSGNTFVVFQPVDSFEMGVGSRLAHKRSIPRRFGICIHEVTIGQLEPFLQDMLLLKEQSLADEGDGGEKTANGQYNRINDLYNLLQEKKDQNLPVGNNDFFLALEYCRWLTDQQGLGPSIKAPIETLEKRYWAAAEDDEFNDGMGYEWFDLEQSGYRLPTAGEWEFACRARTKTMRSLGIVDDRLSLYAWYLANSANTKHPVAQKKPNEAGLFDMLGNVSECCLDWYRDDLPDDLQLDTPWIDFTDQRHRTVRECRGGSYEDVLRAVQTSTRAPILTNHGFDSLGFRLARTYPPVTESESTPSQENEK